MFLQLWHFPYNQKNYFYQSERKIGGIIGAIFNEGMHFYLNSPISNNKPQDIISDSFIFFAKVLWDKNK